MKIDGDLISHVQITCFGVKALLVLHWSLYNNKHDFLLAGFCLFYAVHGVLREREFELYVYIVGIVVLLIYIIIDLIVNRVNRTTLKWVSLSVNYCSTQDMKALSYCNLELFLVISSLINVG